MKIGIDARSILNPEKSDMIGVGHYTYQLIRHLLKHDQENQYVLFFDYRVREKDVKKFSQPNVIIKYFPWSDYKQYLPGAYSEILGMATLTGHNLDLLHTTSPDARVPLGYRGNVICTFQDLAVYQQPSMFPGVKRIRAKYNRRAMAQRADRIIAVSKNTRHDLETILHVPSEKVTVINNGVDERFFHTPDRTVDQLRHDLKQQFNIEKEFLLFIGTLEPIKNITRLLQSFKMMKDIQKEKGLKHDYQLAIGGKQGWLAEEYIQQAKDLNIIDDVRFLGYVEGDDLIKLLRGTKLFVMPSLYEGFGMSVLEAMAAGAPCMVADLPPLREIAGQAVRFVNPLDEQQMANSMVELIEDEAERQRLIATGRSQATLFSWDTCAKETSAVYQELLQKK